MRTAKSKEVKFWSKKLCKMKCLLLHLVVMLRRKKAPVKIGCWSQGWGCMHSPVGLNSRIEHHRCGDTWFCRSSSDGKAVPVVTGPHPLPLLPSQLILDSTLNVKETHFCTAVIAEALLGPGVMYNPPRAVRATSTPFYTIGSRESNPENWVRVSKEIEMGTIDYEPF